jgi:hypothetical protein
MSIMLHMSAYAWNRYCVAILSLIFLSCDRKQLVPAKPSENLQISGTSALRSTCPHNRRFKKRPSS